MPEGPEVARMIYEVHQHFIGKTCIRVEIRGGKYTRHGVPRGFNDFQNALPLTLKQAETHGKFAWLSWTKNWDTWVQFGMTGYFCSSEFLPASIPHIRREEEARKCDKHGHIWFHFRDSEPLVFADQRNFGNLSWTNNPKETQDYVDKLGPDPLREELTKKWWDSAAVRLDKKPKKMIAEILLDQTFVAGIGNYLRSEILWKAGIHPEREWGNISKKERTKLWELLEEVPREKSEEEERTGDLTFWVYQEKKDPNGNPVIPVKIKGRTVWIAPEVQK